MANQVIPTSNCANLQESLDWCLGKPVLPGLRRRAYYISKNNIAKWPALQMDAYGRVTNGVYQGDFELVAGAEWHYIDFIPAKSSAKSEAQGEQPSQTQKNTVVLVHPGVDALASMAASYLNNNDNVIIVQDAGGKWRVCGSEMFPAVTTVAQDLGEGPSGTASTTITHEATDLIPFPEYSGNFGVD